MAEFAQGGMVPGRVSSDGSLPIPVQRGCVFAPASLVKSYGAEFLTLLNGSSDTEVVGLHE